MNEFVIGGNGTTPIKLQTQFLNRHGMICGATGTGKTVTLQVLVEQFSLLGIPSFVTDIKGDLSGLASPGNPHPKIKERLAYIGNLQHTFSAAAVTFWDVDEIQGHPLRTTISELGPLLLASLLELNEVQTGALYACFKEADSHGLLLLDVPDLHAMLNFIGDNSDESSYGKISSATIGAIKRRLLIFEEQGLEKFLGEPAVELSDLMHIESDGKGTINILDVTKLVQTSPRLYATVLIWLLSELFEDLPEVGDQATPKFAIFIDEAHLLFSKTVPALADKIEQVVRLIRSKGVGVFFVTQSPLDIPEAISNQLALKIQHALRAFTPKEKKNLKEISDTFYPNPTFDTETVLPQLSTGEALISTLNDKGSPTPVERTMIAPPQTQIGPINQALREKIIKASPLEKLYRKKIDRESAHELLLKRAERVVEDKGLEKANDSKTTSRRTSNRQSAGEAFVKSISRAIGSQLGRQIVRGILGSIFKGR